MGSKRHLLGKSQVKPDHVQGKRKLFSFFKKKDIAEIKEQFYDDLYEFITKDDLNSEQDQGISDQQK